MSHFNLDNDFMQTCDENGYNPLPISTHAQEALIKMQKAVFPQEKKEVSPNEHYNPGILKNVHNPEHGCCSSAPAEVTIEDRLKFALEANAELFRKNDYLEWKLKFVMDMLALLKSK